MVARAGGAAGAFVVRRGEGLLKAEALALPGKYEDMTTPRLALPSSDPQVYQLVVPGLPGYKVRRDGTRKRVLSLNASLPLLPDPLATQRAVRTIIADRANVREKDHDAVAFAVNQAGRPLTMPWPQVRLEWTIYYKGSPAPKDWAQRMAMVKAMEDGLVLAGVITDDSVGVVPRPPEIAWVLTKGQEQTVITVEKVSSASGLTRGEGASLPTPCWRCWK